MKNLLLILFIAVLAPVGFGQSSFTFDKLVTRTNDPSVDQQQNAIVSNNISKCTISKWEQSANLDTLTKKDELITIFYNKYGLIDSIVENTYETKKSIYTYDKNNNLTNIKTTIHNKLAQLIEGVGNEWETVIHDYKYNEQKQLNKEEIVYSKDTSIFKFNYTWKNNQIVLISKQNNKDDIKVKYTYQYNSNQLVKIIIASNSHDRMKPDRTKQLIYKDSLLTELTNTWVFPLELINTDTLFQMYKDQGERLTDITSTKFEYYPNRRLKKLKKVYKKKLDNLDRFLRILWRKEVEYKINI